MQGNRRKMFQKNRKEDTNEKRLAWYNRCCYTVGQLGEVSMIDIEHTILRRHLTQPSTWGKKWAAPRFPPNSSKW